MNNLIPQEEGSSLPSKGMNKQEIFNKVARHLLTQGKRAISKGGYCSYRGNDNTSCAIGCLIPDELYDPEMEGRGLSSIMYCEKNDPRKAALRAVMGKTFPDLVMNDSSKDLVFLVELQRIHDRLPIEEWKRALAGLAYDNSLNSEVLNEFTQQNTI